MTYGNPSPLPPEMYPWKVVHFFTFLHVSSPSVSAFDVADDFDVRGKSVYATFEIPTIFRLRKNFANYFQRKNYSDIQIDVFIGDEADSGLANLILRDCAKEATVVVGGCSTAGSRCVRTTGFRPKVKNLILVYKNGDAIDLDYLRWSFGNRWNPRARVIVCVGKIVERTALEILSYFWKRDLLNVALTVQSENTESSSENFIYNPFVPRESPAGSRGILKRLNPGDDVFPDKLADLYNETIPISVFFHFPKSILMNFTTPREGADIEVLAALSKKLNFSVALKTAKVFAPSYTVTLSNGEKVGMIGDVLINRSVIVLSAQYMETTMGRNVEFTYPTLQTTQLVLVPKAGVMPMLVRMLQPYPEEIWIAELSVVGFLLICFALMGEDNKVMKLLNLLLHHTFGKIFNRTFNRVFCISCIWWAYLMATVYQATLTKELLAPQYYKDLNTLEELYESKLPLIVGDNMMEVLNNSEVPALKNLAKRAVKHLVLDDCTRQLLRSFNVSCASDEYVVHLLSNFYKKNNAIMIHPVKEYLSRHWDVYVTKYGFPLLDKFNQHIQGLLEAGLYGKWVTDVLKKQFNKKGEEHEVTILTLKHCEGMFAVLALGAGVSTIVFFIELATYRLSADIKNLFPSCKFGG